MRLTQPGHHVDQQTQHECSKHGPVAVEKRVGNLFKFTAVVHLTLTRERFSITTAL